MNERQPARRVGRGGLSRVGETHRLELTSRLLVADFLKPYRARPRTYRGVARRLITGALGMATTKEELATERRTLREEHGELPPSSAILYRPSPRTRSRHRRRLA